MPNEISALEIEQAELAEKLSDPEVFKDFEQTSIVQNRTEKIELLLLEKLERWENLEIKQNELEV